MAEKFNIDLGELSAYTPTEGIGSSGLLKMDGYYAVQVSKIILKKSSGGNPMFLISQIVQDADEKGQQLLNNVLVGGKDKNGEPLARQLGDFLTGIGMTPDQIHTFAANGVRDAEEVSKMFIGKTAYVSVEAETYDNKMSSKIQNYISKQRWEDAVAAGAARKPRRADAQAAVPAGLVVPGNVGGPAATNGAAPGGQDPMAKLKSLNLPI